MKEPQSNDLVEIPVTEKGFGATGIKWVLHRVTPNDTHWDFSKENEGKTWRWPPGNLDGMRL